MAENIDGVKSQILMRVDEATEDKVKDENIHNEKKEEILNIKSSQICSPVIKPILAPSQFNSDNTFCTDNPLDNKIGYKSLLKPSKLGTNSGTQSMKNSFTLNPSKLNPFAKTPVDEDSDCDSDKCNKNNNSAVNGDTPKFVPLLHTENKNSEIIVKPVTTVLPTNQASQSNFIFGQNLQDRVISENTEDCKPSTSCLNSNGSSDMLFSSVIKDTKLDNVDTVASKEIKSLSESAREYEESRAIKRKYEEVEIKTGEEEEINILHISCKLFAFDKALGWQERGRGNLRLNDQDVSDNSCSYKQSRLVFRTFGSLRVILNTKIWADMTIQQASPKSIRLTAIESNGEIKVFLIMASTEDIAKLYKHLDERLKNEINRQKHKKVTVFEEDCEIRKSTELMPQK